MADIEIPRRNLLKQKMMSGELTLGMIARVLRGVEVAALAYSAGYDCIYIDLEHNSFSLETVGQISIAAAALGVTPIVRVPGHDQAMISRSLETGAQGVIVPNVETPEQAYAIVQAAKYPPLGNRSLLGINPLTLFRGGPAAELMPKMNDEILVVCMIESVLAVENAEAIAAIAGVDMLLSGANDLCNSMGIPGEHDNPLLREKFQEIAAACEQHGKIFGLGGMNSRPQTAKDMLALGARYISAGSDAGFLLEAARNTAKFYR